MSKSNRKKFGQLGQPIPATRVLVKDLDPAHFGGGHPKAIIAINDNEGTFTAANVYGEPSNGNLGKGYDPTSMTHPLPAEGDEKWKIWRKRQYTEGKVGDFDVLTQVAIATPKAPKAPKAKKDETASV
jgi:hypothetical protein